MGKFVVHEHHARHLHWDLRLEMNGVLKSWAVPKGVPLKPGVRRLAIQVEDHPISYIDFEGVIPEGMYGAGRVKIWDKGSFRLVERKPDKLVIEFKGSKLSGLYVLLRAYLAGKKENWLIFKKKLKNDVLQDRRHVS